jgi:nitrite reductase (NADH) large subunit
VAYDKLLLTTGSNPLMPNVPGISLPGVVTFRDIADVDAMMAAAKEGKRAIVIGGGLLGLEAAWGLKRQGMPVALVHLMPTLMERQLDIEASGLLQRDLTDRGLNFFTNAQTEEIYGEGQVQGLRLADGRDVPGDIVVVAIGIRPNVALAKDAGLDVNRGIRVGDDMSTSDPNIYAVGECIEHNGQVFGLVAPIWDQAKVCAARLAGDDHAAYATPALATRLKITGIDVFSAGQLAAQDEADAEIIFRDASRGAYKKLVVRDNKLVGAVMYGDVADSAWYFRLLREQDDISANRDTLIFGEAFANLGHPVKPGADIASMKDDYQVCGCNGVSKGTIVNAIKAHGLTSLDEVKAHTKAAGSCGQCSSVVQSILVHVVGGEVNTSESICKCTDLGHDEVRAAIVNLNLKTQDDIRSSLGWKTHEGCSKCRPALNYYLLCAWPGEYLDDPRSRFINERAHANIQKNGTYSVVPRMWGGLTTPNELRAIADVADKFNIPTVKVTGGQRIDLLGVKKEDLPHVWADLGKAGLVSGHAYAKGLRTVKTCVGSEWCRFGTQDSTGLGVKLEKMMWGSWTPHKFKLAVSGCPRNCAESSIKDMGIICVDAGYDLLIGGNGGIELRETDLLCRVTTEEEVLEYAASFMQLYREEGHYMERTAPYVERVGMPHIISKIVTNETTRKALADRFLYSQSFAQIDPWAERANGVEADEFNPMAVVA